MTEQKARELEMRNLQQAFEGKGKPASFVADPAKADTYTVGALGVMSSYNRHGAVAASANYGTMQAILRDEWGFKGYNVTDFTGVSLKAAPKESILFGTTAFCGFGVSVDYWNADAFAGDRDMLLAIKDDIKYVLYSLANSAALNGVQGSGFYTVELQTSWRTAYTVAQIACGVLLALSVVCYVIGKCKKERSAK